MTLNVTKVAGAIESRGEFRNDPFSRHALAIGLVAQLSAQLADPDASLNE